MTKQEFKCLTIWEGEVIKLPTYSIPVSVSSNHRSNSPPYRHIFCSETSQISQPTNPGGIVGHSIDAIDRIYRHIANYSRITVDSRQTHTSKTQGSPNEELKRPHWPQLVDSSLESRFKCTYSRTGYSKWLTKKRRL